MNQERRTDLDRWLRQAILKWPLLGLLIGAIILSGLLLEGAGLVGVWPNQTLAALAFQTLQPLPDKFLFAIGAQAPAGQFNLPVGMAVAPDGTVYVADYLNHRMQRFTADGSLVVKWGSGGNGDGQFNWPRGVAVAPDGTVYVADTFNDRIQRFSATGQFLGKWGSYGSGDGQFDHPHSVAVASNGTVYVADTSNHRIQRFSATGQFLSKWGSYGSSDGQFNYPSSVAVAPDGTMYVADRNNHRIQRFSATGQFLGKWGSYGSDNGQFNGPEGVAVAPDGAVYVADSGNDRIQHFSAYGSFLSKWGSKGSGDGQFDWPRGVAVAPDGTVYVADTFNHRIQRFSATGQFLDKWGSWGSGDGQFNHPHSVAVASNGTVYVADTSNHRIQRFSATGQFLGKWGSYGSSDGQFNYPSSVAVAPDGTMYVADRNNHRIQRFSATGQFLGKWGSYGSDNGQFNGPEGVAVAPDGTVYVADSGNDRIQRFSAYGSFLGKWGSKGSGDGQFWGPTGVAMAPDGTVYVADIFNYRVQRFSATGQFLGKWGWWGSDNGQFYYPYSVAVALDSTVYVADQGNLRIQAFGTAYPATWRGEYFANRWLAGAPVLIRQDASIDFAWGSDSPGPGVPAEFFSARWYRYVWFEEGNYVFTVYVDDGVRLWVEEQLLIDQWWHPQISTYTAEVHLSRGYHKVQMEYYEGWGAASVRLSWQARSPDTYEPDDTCAQANWIGVGGPAQRHTLDWAEDVDWVKFNATAGTWYEIKTSNLGSNADTVLELYDTGCGGILAANDDYMSGSLASRIIWVAPASSTYYVKVRPYSSSRTGTDSDYDLTVVTTTPHGIPLQVRNQAGNPATYFWTEAYVPGTASPIFRDWGGMSGYSFLGVPDGTYTLVAGSGNDHFLLVKPNVIAPSTLTLDTGGTVSVNVYAYQQDGSPLKDQTSVYLRPYYGSYGWVGRPDGNGYLPLNATPGSYNAFVWSWDYLYYLVRPNVGIWGPITLNLDARTMPTGQINVSLQGMDRAGVLPWGSYTSWAPYLTTDDGDSIVLSPDSYEVTGYLYKYTEEGGSWYYYFSAPAPLNVTAGGTTTFRGGGTFSASTGPEQPQYRPGQVVTITNTFQDAFANRLTWVEAYTPASATGVETAKEEAMKDPTVLLRDGEVIERRQERMAVPRANAGPSRPELSGAGWNYIYPLTTVRDPTGQIIFQDNTWRGFSTITFTLSAPATEGTYSIISSLDTGPHQGVIQGIGSFQVKLARVYLPLLLKYPYVPPPTIICDGGFEVGRLEPCWQHGGQLARSVVEQLDVGEPTPTVEPPYAGRYSALLGDPSLGDGLEGHPPIPVGSAWIEQPVQVPNTASPRLSFWYRIITYDVAQDAVRQFWDILAVEINGELIFWDGNPESGTSQDRHDLGWRRGEVGLSPWRGQTVTVRFANWNGYSRKPGSELYNTWTYLDEVNLEP